MICGPKHIVTWKVHRLSTSWNVNGILTEPSYITYCSHRLNGGSAHTFHLYPTFRVKLLCLFQYRGAFVKVSNLMAGRELLYPARNYYGTETYRSSILVTTCILLRKLFPGCIDCKNRHKIKIKSLTLVLLQCPAFTLKILLDTLHSSYNYVAVKTWNITS